MSAPALRALAATDTGFPDPGHLAVVASGEVRAVVSLTHLLCGPGAAHGLARPIRIRTARHRATDRVPGSAPQDGLALERR